jgi:galactan endo-1,6-beta-galactosidase
MFHPARLIAAVATAWLTVASLTAQEPAATVRINPSVTHGVWEGWGTSLCWMGKIFGDRDDLADFLFTTRTVTFAGKPVPGLGMNIVRYNAGACSDNSLADGRRMVVSKIIKPFRQIDSFWLDPRSTNPDSTSWNWKADANQRAMLLKARDRGAKHFELFSNSPPWWLCANDNPSGAATATDDNLPVENHAAFATYLATVAKVAKERWGIAFTSVAPFNEPMSDWWFADCKQEGCHFSHEAQQKFLPILRAELDRQNLRDLSIAASDETHYDHAVDTWKSFPPAVKAVVARVNVHGYQYAKGRRDELHRLVVKEDGKQLWMSEYGKKDGGGLELARNFHRDMDRLHPTAWCYWQPTDGGGWGLLDADLTTAQIRGIETNAYVFAQYSRHLRPGMVILETGDDHTVAAYDARARSLVIAIFNDGPARTVRFDLSSFRVSDGSVSSILTVPKTQVRYERQPDIQLSSRRFEASLPADSIQTFELRNITTP